MIKLEEILSYYPKELYKFKQFIFKEYLQYLILKIIFESKYANKLSFLGGTNLRIVHNNTRFSEDLDFDNFGLENIDFIELSNIIKKELEKNGFQVEIKTIFKGAYRCSVKIPKLLKDLGFSNFEDEKILIQIDTAPHNFEYKPEVSILNRFGLVFSINTTPLDIITSQKIYAIFNRNRPKGRDFFDLVFLLSKSKPNIDYIKDKLGFSTLEETKYELLKFCDKLDFEDLTNDVEIFLFEESGKNNLKFFKEIIKNTL